MPAMPESERHGENISPLWIAMIRWWDNTLENLIQEIGKHPHVDILEYSVSERSATGRESQNSPSRLPNIRIRWTTGLPKRDISIPMHGIRSTGVISSTT